MTTTNPTGTTSAKNGGGNVADLSSPACVRHAALIARDILERRANDPTENCAIELRILADAAQRIVTEMTELIPTQLERRTT